MDSRSESHRLELAISDAVGRLSVLSLAMDSVAESHSPMLRVGPCHCDGDWVVVGIADGLRGVIHDLKSAGGLDDLPDESARDESQNLPGDITE